MPWRVHTDVQPDSTIHVWPVHDWRVHELTGARCWCLPDLEEQPNGAVMVSHRDQLDRGVRL